MELNNYQKFLVVTTMICTIVALITYTMLVITLIE